MPRKPNRRPDPRWFCDSRWNRPTSQPEYNDLGDSIDPHIMQSHRAHAGRELLHHGGAQRTSVYSLGARKNHEQILHDYLYIASPAHAVQFVHDWGYPIDAYPSVSQLLRSAASLNRITRLVDLVLGNTTSCELIDTEDSTNLAIFELPDALTVVQYNVGRKDHSFIDAEISPVSKEFSTKKKIDSALLQDATAQILLEYFDQALRGVRASADYARKSGAIIFEPREIVDTPWHAANLAIFRQMVFEEKLLKPCRNCGKLFEPINRRQDFCPGKNLGKGSACRTAYWRKVQKP